MDAEALLLQIARCPVVEECLTDDAGGHPCTRVVLHQWPGVDADERRARWLEEHRLPEPWVGQLTRAPLLFLGSNPVLRPHGGARAGEPAAPSPAWPDADLVARPTAAFDVWMPDGVHPLDGPGGVPGKPVPFWRAVKKLARQLLGRHVVPGIDYALTTVVHCPSRDEDGVAEAARECVARYLRPVLAASPARLVVVLGTPARNAFRATFDYHDPAPFSRPVELEGRVRHVVFLAHPSTRGKTAVPRGLEPPDLAAARAILARD